jgi:hypothetical protein
MIYDLPCGDLQGVDNTNEVGGVVDLIQTKPYSATYRQRNESERKTSVSNIEDVISPESIQLRDKPIDLLTETWKPIQDPKLKNCIDPPDPQEAAVGIY